MVSGRTVAALGAVDLLARGRSSRSGTTRRCSPTSACRRRVHVRRRAALRHHAGAQGWASSTTATVQAGFEDALDYLWRERQLPINVDPFDARLSDELERNRLRRVYSQGLEGAGGLRAAAFAGREPGPGLVGGPPWVIPARGISAASACILIPGDSPMGYRLPLDSLASGARQRVPVHCGSSAIRWTQRGALPTSFPVAPGRRALGAPGAGLRYNIPACRSARRDRRRKSRGRCPGGAHAHRRRPSQPGTGTGLGVAARAGCQPRGRGRRGHPAAGAGGRPPSRPNESATWITRTALCVEAARRPASMSSCRRSSALEDYLELVAAIERPPRSSRASVILEGYPPPRDPRLEMLQVTPDPGVIEVNIHPAPNWDDSSSTPTSLYEEARQSRLGSRKIHARRPPHRHRRRQPHRPRRRRRRPTARSCAGPICWKPDRLLAQPPVPLVPVHGPLHRPDQPGAAGRRGAERQLYELEIAFKQIDRRQAAVGRGHAPVARRPHLPQSADRRHRQHPPRRVLHRQALFAGHRHRPPGPARVPRLRDAAAPADEPRRSSCCCARWSRASGTSPTWRGSSRWGTELHDRFLLPHFVQHGLRRGGGRSARAGYPFDPEWFAPHFEFRFPLYRRRSRRAASSSSCARRSSRGTCWAKRARPAARRATSTRRSSGCRCTSRGLPTIATSITVQRRRVPLQPTGTDGDSSPACASRLAAAVGAASDDRRACAADFDLSTPGSSARSAAATITSRIPAAATTTGFRSTPTRPRAGGWRGSSDSDIHRAGWQSSRPRRAGSSHSRWTFDIRARRGAEGVVSREGRSETSAFADKQAHAGPARVDQASTRVASPAACEAGVAHVAREPPHMTKRDRGSAFYPTQSPGVRR